MIYLYECLKVSPAIFPSQLELARKWMRDKVQISVTFHGSRIHSEISCKTTEPTGRMRVFINQISRYCVWLVQFSCINNGFRLSLKKNKITSLRRSEQRFQIWVQKVSQWPERTQQLSLRTWLLLMIESRKALRLFSWTNYHVGLVRQLSLSRQNAWYQTLTCQLRVLM